MMSTCARRIRLALSARVAPGEESRACARTQHCFLIESCHRQAPDDARFDHDRLLATVDEHPWQQSMDHRVQVYGYNYNHSLRGAYRIGEIPAWGMALARQLQQDGYAASVPNQLVANEYQAGIGIFDHIDQAVFGDVVIAVSLGSTCAMRFTSADPEASGRSSPNSPVKARRR